MNALNKKVVLAQRPDDTATADCFKLIEEPLQALAPGEVRIGVEYISVDAGTRTMLRGEGFHQQVGLGDTILAGGVGRVIESNSPQWPLGQAVRGGFGAQTIATVSAGAIEAVDEQLAPLSAYLGVLGGSTGVTAWIGVRCVAKPKAGDVFVVSAAAGAVGSIVGQIAQREGAQVIGIAGGAQKTDYLCNRLGFDHAIDYKNEDVNARLKSLAPQGVDGFFDNVGGDVLDAVLDNLAMHAKVVICGAISQYNHMDNVTGPSMYLRLAERQATMEGFAYFHFPEQIPVAAAELAQWLVDDALVFDEHVLEGIDQYPNALGYMFEGKNIGKLLVKASG